MPPTDHFTDAQWESVLVAGVAAGDIAGVLGLPLAVVESRLGAARVRLGWAPVLPSTPPRRAGRMMVGLLSRPDGLRSNFRPITGRRANGA